MFDKNFYPTPKEIAFKMIEGLDLRGVNILEPSAGKGDILEVIESKTANIYCIEKNQELQSILREKKYTILGDDFLKFKPDHIFDVILMNPPFDNGVKHLLKAWEISEEGTQIRCLLNRESIENPCTKEKKLLLNIIQNNNGEIEYLGNCFKNGERKTNVEIVLIKLQNKTKRKKFQFNFNEFQKEEINIEELNINQLAKIDILQNLEDRYISVKKLIEEYLVLKNKLEFYLDGIMDKYTVDTLLAKSFNNKNREREYEEIIGNIRNRFWQVIFSKTKLEEKMTSNVKKDFFGNKKEYSIMPFTVENVNKLLEILIQNSKHIFQNCIEEIFDYLTAYYPENRVHIEGWKTNERWMVGRKFILPNMINWLDLKYVKSNIIKSLDYTKADKLRDLEKVLCNLIGKDIMRIKTIEQTIKEGIEFSKWYKSEFFRFKVFKKGTIHFEFLDEKIWNQFNNRACEGKKWLGY
ncbi:protein of unknown function [Cetobacterium ceti]|uniref:DUF4942 domain-containing protein n=1 Tax=Cetobacterium ceti TaxID=180163 RepID=A0A1T4R0P3_9FUSO|nr:DUF4942 domain-containing protein [Cetobacterium ceti]SKA09560.1 protein of unknown function [Cetobacterium ceti]